MGTKQARRLLQPADVRGLSGALQNDRPACQQTDHVAAVEEQRQGSVAVVVCGQLVSFPLAVICAHAESWFASPRVVLAL
jgi:hypothetical protein